jgi:L-ascorbate metabolism protein UlaG (beta-lactamase superfamily)
MQYIVEKSRFRIAEHRQDASFKELLKWQLQGNRAKWPRRIANADYPAPEARVHGSNLVANWIGHSTVLIQTGGLNILTDPFFSKRASPVRVIGPTRVRDAGVAIENLPPIDLILLSHNHYDHLDLPSLRKLQRRFSPRIIAPLNNGRYVRRAGREINLAELDWRQSVQFADVNITLMPALHWSKRSFSDTNRALWGAFVIEAPGGMIYFGGDTGYGNGSTFVEVRLRFGAPRLSLLPIGAYEPRWFMKPQHMNPEEAVMAHIALASRTSIAIHHGTLQLTDEAIDQPVKDLDVALEKLGVGKDSFLVPDVGESVLGL